MERDALDPRVRPKMAPMDPWELQRYFRRRRALGRRLPLPAWALTGFAVTFATSGTLGWIGERHGWWTNHPYWLNIISAVTGACIGLPVVIIGIPTVTRRRSLSAWSAIHNDAWELLARQTAKPIVRVAAMWEQATRVPFASTWTDVGDYLPRTRTERDAQWQAFAYARALMWLTDGLNVDWSDAPDKFPGITSDAIEHLVAARDGIGEARRLLAGSPLEGELSPLLAGIAISFRLCEDSERRRGVDDNVDGPPYATLRDICLRLEAAMAQLDPRTGSFGPPGRKWKHYAFQVHKEIAFWTLRRHRQRRNPVYSGRSQLVALDDGRVLTRRGVELSPEMGRTEVD